MAARKTLSQSASEGGSFVFPVDFKDVNDLPVTPASISWTLTDGDGDVVNGREAVAVAVPASTIWIALEGDDLQMRDEELGREARLVTVTAGYDHSKLADASLVQEFLFYIDNMRAK